MLKQFEIYYNQGSKDILIALLGIFKNSQIPESIDVTIIRQMLEEMIKAYE